MREGARIVNSDYAKWKKKELWTIFEASCLVAGAEPPPGDRITVALSNIADKKKRTIAGEIYEHAKDAIDLKKLRQAARSRTMLIMHTRVTPGDFVAWIEKSGDYSIPEALKDIKPSPPKADVSEKERTTYNHIIGALLQVIDGKFTANKHPDFHSQTQLIDTLANKYEGVSGMSKRNLQKKFAEAKGSLE